MECLLPTRCNSASFRRFQPRNGERERERAGAGGEGEREERERDFFEQRAQSFLSREEDSKQVPLEASPSFKNRAME